MTPFWPRAHLFSLIYLFTLVYYLFRFVSAEKKLFAADLSAALSPHSSPCWSVVGAYLRSWRVTGIADLIGPHDDQLIVVL